MIEAQQRVLEETPEGTPMSFIPHDRGLTMFHRVMKRLIREQDAVLAA